MARPRSETTTLVKEGHNISLKVLRLSRPSLAQQTPLTKSNIAGISSISSQAFPSSAIDGDFILTPILSLPPSFGSAYVGETFSCAIVANNELDASSVNPKIISNLRLVAEMQTPTQNFPLQLLTSKDAIDVGDQDFQPGSSVQRIIEFPLREEGSHTLVVGIYYTETIAPVADDSTSPSSATSTTTATTTSSANASRARTFRKMYQFPTVPCLSVRTKATELPPLEISEKTLGDPYGRTTLLRYVLEAQLENVSETRITLEHAGLVARPPFKAIAMNEGIPSSSPVVPSVDVDIDVPRETTKISTSNLNTSSDPNQNRSQATPILNPRSVHQLLFYIEQQPNVTTGLEELKANLKGDGRTILGQIALEWRSGMGERGSLSTGNLLTRRK